MVTKHFLKELTRVSNEYGIAIAGCGCCGSPSLYEVREKGAYSTDTDNCNLTFQDIEKAGKINQNKDKPSKFSFDDIQLKSYTGSALSPAEELILNFAPADKTLCDYLISLVEKISP